MSNDKNFNREKISEQIPINESVNTTPEKTVSSDSSIKASKKIESSKAPTSSSSDKTSNTSRSKKKRKKTVSAGKVSINATFNNVMVTIADNYGNVIVWKTSGSVGYKGPKKSTPFAAQVTAEAAGKEAQSTFGFKEADVTLSGTGPGRDSALRGLNSVGITIKTLAFKSAVAHGGCRPKKSRRI